MARDLPSIANDDRIVLMRFSLFNLVSGLLNINLTVPTKLDDKCL